MYDEEGRPYDEGKILPLLHKVVKLSHHEEIGIGVLTTEHRDVWADAFKRLIQS